MYSGVGSENPMLNAGMVVAWLVVTLEVLYRYWRGDWSRLRAVLFVSVAAAWIAQSVDETAPLFGLGSPVTDWLFAGLSVVFVAGAGYTVVLWRRTDD
jgi:FtsH-binding integral membrane protein